MTLDTHFPVRRLRRHRLAAALVALLLPSLPTVASTAAEPSRSRPTAVISVTNCDDAGAGSLRDAVAIALSGDTIDLDGLGCSQITLTSGEILIPQDDLTIKYSQANGALITVSGNLASRVFHHTGHGTLAIDGVEITEGKYDTTSGGGAARGGCIESEGSVDLNHAIITQCSAQATSPAYGGGVAATDTFYLANSTIDGCGATSDSNAFGGGIFLETGPATIVASTISNNATSRMAGLGLEERGGGLFVRTPATLSMISGSTFSGNQSSYGGAMDIETGSAYGVVVIENSTIADNAADYCGGGIETRVPFEIANSTIAFNTAGGVYGGGGVCLAAGAGELQLSSTIVAANTASSGRGGFDVYAFGATISGQNNLIVSSNIAVPPDTVDADAELLPLADNGGPTQTLALDTGSPAIDTGNNEAGFANDQRGAGYARVFGAAADIGAYERQPVDQIFANGFD